MNLRRFALLSIAALVFTGCAGEVAKNQTTESPMPVVANASPSPNQSDAIAQSGGTTKKVVRSGNFVSGEHPTQGTARIVTQNGKSFLELDQGFKTFEMGPDLVVVLHRSSDVISSTLPPAYPLKEGDYVVLAPLQKFSGAQRYAIPTNVNLADFQSAVIWCRQFNATFGAATLNT